VLNSQVGFGTIKNQVKNMNQLHIKCQEVTEVINNVLNGLISGLKRSDDIQGKRN
jgi:hypothetical protein